MSSVLLYWHTLKHLKPVQFWYRLWYSIYKPTPKTLGNLKARKASGVWRLCSRAPSMLGRTSFRFLNQTHTLSSPGYWRREDLSDLWLFNAHYFDDLNTDDASARKVWHEELIRLWIAENPPSQPIAWHPYPTSLRIVNWTKWLVPQNTVQTQMLDSLSTQASWLSKRLEFHVQGNHLWANAKALIFAGVYFQGDDAENWLAKGASLMKQQLDIQILSDGGHFERSPMYHSILLEDLLDLVQLSKSYPSTFNEELMTKIDQKIGQMFQWLDAMVHPDGGIAFFNDSTLGIAPNLKQLQEYAESIEVPVPARAGDKSIELLDTGYVRASNGSAELIADVGEIGPAFQPGHAHADTLSFELSLFAARVIVNSGIDRYGKDAERLRQRGTEAHSSVVVDGESSSEVWSGFRVARRANPVNYNTSLDNGVYSIACGHDGYTRLPGKVIHKREWLLSEGSLDIIDALEGSFSDAIAKFYLYPGIEVQQISESSCTLLVRDRIVTLSVTGGDLQCADSLFFPSFNISKKSTCLNVVLTGNRCITKFQWEEPKA